MYEVFQFGMLKGAWSWISNKSCLGNICQVDQIASTPFSSLSLQEE